MKTVKKCLEKNIQEQKLHLFCGQSHVTNNVMCLNHKSKMGTRWDRPVYDPGYNKKHDKRPSYTFFCTPGILRRPNQ
jgi:hypothetical protein